MKATIPAQMAGVSILFHNIHQVLVYFAFPSFFNFFTSLTISNASSMIIGTSIIATPPFLTSYSPLSKPESSQKVRLF